MSDWIIRYSRSRLGWMKGSKRGLTVGTQDTRIEHGCWAELFELETKGNTFSWNVTSLETKTVWESRSKTLKPLTLKGKPRKTHFLALGENLDLV